MNGKPVSQRSRWRRGSSWTLLGLFLAALCVTPARSADWRKGKWFISFDNTVTYGVSYRLDDPDERIIGLVNGGSAFSVNGDDGNLNYDTGIFSNALQLTSELEVDHKNFGAFFRGWGFYDYENKKGDRARTPLSEAALDRVGSRYELRDAYAWYKFRIGQQPAEIRAGQQVISWGESTFIQGGINIINPVDVTALRTPGAELRNGLLPVGTVWGSFSLSTNTTLELFYEYEWEEIEIDPPGSYFSTNDFAGDGGELVYLGFGSSPDIPPYPDPSDPSRPFLAVPRESDVTADDGGQYGVALRWFVPALGQTEFGFYYIDYNSRLPTINGRTGTVAGLTTFGTIVTTAPAIVVATQTWLLMNPGDIPGAIQAGTVAGVTAGAPQGASTAIAATSATGGDMSSTTTAFATDAYAQTARYFLEYPEDIKLYGISFNSQIGTSGIALQGELSYRQDAPLQIDDVELLFAALQPINPILAGNVPGLEAGASQITTFTGVDYSDGCNLSVPDFSNCEQPVTGFIREDTAQFQTTLTKIWSQALGADQVLFLWEGAVTHIPDMPSTSELRLEGAGTYTSGNPYHEDPGNPGAAHAPKPAESAQFFADSTSWGYRLVTRFQYNNAIGAITLRPRLGWGHDVKGNSPGPGGNFIEGRKALTLGLNFDFQSKWAADISYTNFSGAGRYNLINDRDFVAANFKYSF
jgi:hypothetical protein